MTVYRNKRSGNSKINTIVNAIRSPIANASNDNYIDVYLFAGQSNMVGQDSDAGLTAEQASQAHLLYHTNSLTSDDGADHWITLQPVGSDFGPEIGFGTEMSDQLYGYKCAIIKHAVNSTGISPDCATSGWYPVYDAVNPGDSLRYRQLIAAAELAGKRLVELGYIPILKGFCWMQGEQDALLLATGQDYETNVTLLVTKLRAHFKNNNMPFVLGRIRTEYGGAGNAEVRTAQANIDEDSGDAAAINNVHMCNLDTFTMQDTAHFDAEGYLDIGGLMARKMIEYVTVNKHGVNSLDPYLDINGTVVKPTFRYKCGDADGTDLNFWRQGEDLDLHAGTAPSYNQGSPAGSNWDLNTDSVLFNGGGYYLADNTTFAQIGTGDFVIELVYTHTNTGVLAALGTWTSGTNGYIVYPSDTLLVFRIDDGTQVDLKASGFVDGTTYHVMIFVNRDENSVNSAVCYKNGVSAGTANLSTASGDLDSSTTAFSIGARSDGAIPYDEAIFYAAMWEHASWHQAGASGPTEWAAIALARYNAFAGV